MSDEYSFGIIAKNRRRELGLTQDELARRVGCAPITLRKIEADDLRPSVQIAERLAMALNIPLEERSAFVRLARTERPILEEPSVTPMPAPEEIGSEDLSGRAIRGYALGERLGNGGMGVVYRAVQPLVEREVAIKIIMPMYANHPDFIRRFEAEAQLVARLEHPHIVPLYDYWREPGVAYLIMRLLRGGSVQSLLRGGTVLSSETILRMMEQIGSALSSSHRAGVVHRDLKPANVLLDEDNNAYLADFGIAKNLSSPSSETQADMVIGSPDYISPEQIRSEFVRPQTDIYALGVMLYELLTGKVPFRGNTPFDVMSQHLNTPLPMLAEYRMGLPRSLDEVIERATAKDPLERYENVELMLNDLRNALSAAPLEIKSKASSLQETIPPLTELDNPYKGLRAFVEGDAQDFYGRESLIQQLLVKLGDAGELSRFLAVVGPSGSGKSSVVKAGLIPALRRGALPGSENWFIVEMMPGAHPLEELEAALLRVAVNPPSSLMEQFHRDSRGLIRAVRRSLPNDPNIDLVLVIDQFEEVFTLLQDEAERMHFLGLLVTAIMDENSRIRVILTLRADFIDRPLGYVDFGELMRQRMEVILPLTPDELESAIASPAERVGLHLESGLVAAILRDLGDQPGTLPLLQYALTELYEKRAGNTLTRYAYHEIGGVLGALGRRAEEVFKGLDQEGQIITRQIFLRLVTLGEGVEDTRRRALISELENLKLSDVDLSIFSRSFKATLTAFGNARLLSFDRDPGTRGPTVEVAHEAIIREWGRLRDWLEESRSLVRMQRQLSTAASEWLDAKRDDSFLLSGTKLAQYEGWTESSTIALTQHELDYLKASLSAREQREVEEAERQQRELETVRKLAETERTSVVRLRGRNRVISVVGVIAIALAVLAGAFGFKSNQNAQQASSRELAAASVANLNIDSERSTLLALEAVSKTYLTNKTVLPEAEEALHQAVQSMRIELTLYGHTNAVQSVAFSPDGTRLVTSSRDQTVKIWDAMTGKELLTIHDTSQVNNAVFSPDGKYLATANKDNISKIWEVTTGKQLLMFSGHKDSIWSVAFSPDGTRIATASGDGTAKIWDLSSSKELFTLNGHTGWINTVAFSPDGTRIATGSNDETTKVWDATTGNILLTLSGHADSVESLSFSPDGTRLATVSQDRTARIWDVSTGKEIQTFNGNRGVLFAVAFSPDGRYLATCGSEGVVKVWNVQTEISELSLYGHTKICTSLSFSPDGNHLATSSHDGTAKVWDISNDGGKEWFNFSGMYCIAINSDGTRFATVAEDGSVNILDSATGRVLVTLIGVSDEEIWSLAFSPDGRNIATGGYKTVKIWDALTGKNLFTLNAHDDWVTGVSFSSDGLHLATSSNDKTAKVWDTSSYLISNVLSGHTDWVLAVAFSSDGNYLATTSTDKTVRLWDVTTGKELLTLHDHTNQVNYVAFSPDGTRIAATSYDSTVIVWDAITGEKLMNISGHQGATFGVSFSPDGTKLATSSDDGTIKFWEIATGKEILNLIINSGTVFDIAFSPDGSRLISTNLNGVGRVYALHIEDLIAIAKSRLTRSLTTEECQKYLHVDACPAAP